MRANTDRGSTPQERRASLRYLWEIAAGAVGFLVTFLFLPEVVPTEPGSVAGVVVALVPLVPVIWIAVALIRHVDRVDELQRGLLLLSLAIGFGAAMLISLVVVFLSTAAITVEHPEWWVFIGGMAVWGVSIGVLSYRANR
jgi:hypothetical protein